MALLTGFCVEVDDQFQFVFLFCTSFVLAILNHLSLFELRVLVAHLTSPLVILIRFDRIFPDPFAHLEHHALESKRILVPLTFTVTEKLFCFVVILLNSRAVKILVSLDQLIFICLDDDWLLFWRRLWEELLHTSLDHFLQGLLIGLKEFVLGDGIRCLVLRDTRLYPVQRTDNLDLHAQKMPVSHQILFER